MAPEAATILEFLGSCCRLSRSFQAQRGLVVGCFVGCILTLSVSALQIGMDFRMSDRIVVSSLIPFAMVAGYLRGRWSGWSFSEAAAFVDNQFDRKDAISSAVSFAAQKPLNDWHRLLIRDASVFLGTITPADVAIRQLPKHSWYLIPTVLWAIAIVWLPFFLIRHDRSVPKAVPGVSEAAALLHGDLQQLRERLTSDGDPEETHLFNQIEEQLQLLDNPNISLQEAFALLSSIQQQLERHRSRLGRSIANQHLAALAEAMSSIAELRDPAESLQNRRLQEAAGSLESMQSSELPPKVNPDASRMLSELAEAMQQAGLSELAADVSKLATDLSGHPDEDSGDAYQQLAESLRQQDTQEELAKLLADQNRRLDEYKSLLREAGQSDTSTSAFADGSETLDERYRHTGGETNLHAEGGGLAGTGGGRAAGSTSAGNQQGAPTSLESTRQLSSLTGNLSSDGPAEVEKVPSEGTPEETSTSRRNLQTVDATFNRTSQAAMEEDHIPWQYRDTIRRYFEGLRLAEERNRNRK